MTRIVQEHLIKLPHCSGWCLNVLVINRMVFSPLPTRRMSAHSITSPITSGNRIRIYCECVSSRIMSTRKKEKKGVGVAFVEYIFRGFRVEKVEQLDGVDLVSTKGNGWTRSHFLLFHL